MHVLFLAAPFFFSFGKWNVSFGIILDLKESSKGSTMFIFTFYPISLPVNFTHNYGYE